jgi:hypothetical protein
MVKKPNYGKIVAVVLITLLIWVWADLAIDEEFSVSGGKISVAKSTRPNLWVSFNEESSVSIDKIVLKGPASKVADAKQKLKEGLLVLEFFLDPEQEQAMISPKELSVITFLKQSDKIRQLGLTVKSCDPNRLTVNVVELVEKSLVVKCVDESQNPVKTATIEPTHVTMFVPADWEGTKLEAKVSLTRSEINQARLSAIEKVPYIRLPDSQTRQTAKTVKITTPPEEELLGDYSITTATLGITLSTNLQGKYSVVVNNLEEVISAITIRATPDAKRAYEKMPYQVILEIDDEDARAQEPLRRDLLYNFPPEYDRRDEIMLNQQPVTARFKLIPSASEQPQ